MPIHWVIGLSVGVPVPPHLPHLYCLENKTRGGVTTLCMGGANWGGGGVKWENCGFSLTLLQSASSLVMMRFWCWEAPRPGQR